MPSFALILTAEDAISSAFPFSISSESFEISQLSMISSPVPIEIFAAEVVVISSRLRLPSPIVTL